MDDQNNNNYNYNFNDNKNIFGAVENANSSYISNKEKAKLREPNSVNIRLEEVNKQEIEKKKQERIRKNLKEALEWFYCIVIALVVALLVKYYVGTPTIVKQVSMNPTLVENDRLILNRLSRTTKHLPERGQIVTFEAPTKNEYTQAEYDAANPIAKYENEPTGLINRFSYYVLEQDKKSYIKRVIALPGEYVEIKNGNVYIDGKKLDEPYLGSGVDTQTMGVFNKFKVPEGCIFAMGDNRPNSMDCRTFGCIPLDKIEGIVVFRFWPFGDFGKVE